MRGACGAQHHASPNNSGSLAILAAIRRVSSLVSSLAADRRPSLACIPIQRKVSPMQYRGIRYIVRAGIERAQYRAVIYLDGVEIQSNRISGSREGAEADACRMINRWLGQKSANEKQH